MTTDAKSKPYGGPLGAQSAATGIRSALRNSQRLLEDAELCFEQGRFATSVLLSVLAMEEASKPDLLRFILVETDPATRDKIWRLFRHHAKKALFALVPTLYLQDVIADRATYTQVLQKPVQQGERLLELRLRATYCDPDASGQWQHPETTIPSAHAEFMLKLSRVIVEAASSRAFQTEAELEIWSRGFPPSSSSRADRFAAFDRCIEEAHRRGVLRGQVGLDFWQRSTFPTYLEHI